jgi:hypothetical protein
MPKWKKDATEFTVSVNYHETRGYQATIPKPIMERLPDKSKIRFVVRGRRIEVD